MGRPNKPPRPVVTGILVVDKPLGISSMTAVNVVRARAGGTRTGHAGTLDPLATGVLVLALGKATKKISHFMATDKRYATVIDLTAFTTTDDMEGERIEVDVAQPPSESDVQAVLEKFTGRIMQRPPQRSAIKIGGRRAYALSRRGETVEIPARPVDVYRLEIRRYNWPELELYVHCGKGTYIRSLARDIGEALGTGGHCESLRRLAVGPFVEDAAAALEQVPDLLTEQDLIPIDAALQLIDDHTRRFGQADSG
ncbi:MAG: tRNA pseudouridine(55) synthase TruB [Planctomycetes bacterium]|nr:tRNA pseudouridine(55) synthase TruB [Planctomycetota bacterium]